MLEETVVSHLVRPVDLNHHDTLFAGTMSAWPIEACFVSAARLLGRPDDLICVRVHDMNFLRSFRAGDVVDIRARVAHLGTRSIS